MLTPERFEVEAFALILARALDAGDVAAVRLRLLHASDDEIRRVAERLKPVVQERAVAFLLDSHLEIAAAIEADGIHLGVDDIRYAKARALVGADAIIGVDCHTSRHAAMEAAEDRRRLRRLRPVLCVRWGCGLALLVERTHDRALRGGGGITPENCASLVQAGADFLAVADAAWSHAEGPAAAIAAFNQAIADALARREASNSRSGDFSKLMRA